MFHKTLFTTYFILLNYSFAQLSRIDKNQTDQNANVLVINNCSRTIDKCSVFCDYKNINSLQEFKKEESFLLEYLKIVKLDKDFEDHGVTRKKETDTGNKIFLLTDRDVSYRIVLSNKLNTTIYVLNNQTKTDHCNIWIINLNLTSLNNNLLDSEYLKYVETIFKNYVNKQHEKYSYETQIEISNETNIVSLRHSRFYPGEESYDMVKFPEEATADNVSAKLSMNEKQVTKTRDTKVNPAPITIEASLSSELLMKTGSNPRIVFDVINNMDRNVYVIFSCRDEKAILVGINPQGSYIMPGQRRPVTVITALPPNVADGFSDTITLYAQVQGGYKAEKSALLQMSSNRLQDSWKPTVKYQFTTGCFDVSTGTCESSSWMLEVRAQDKESGLLQLNSIPYGLNIPKEYVSGTKEWVTGYYSASCCNPYIEVYAIDLNNNRQSYKLDANDLHLSDASIAAVVLGVILLIVLIVVIVLCVRKRYYSDSRDLPSYRGARS